MISEQVALCLGRLCCTAVFLLSLTGCEKRVGEAVVVAKEHIAAREAPHSPEPEKNPPMDDVEPTEEARELAPDEIDVDGYVMKAVDRGTARDPRAIQEEQWRITVQLLTESRQFKIQADKQFERLKEGDRIRVRYRVGKYTKTVWSGEIVD